MVGIAEVTEGEFSTAGFRYSGVMKGKSRGVERDRGEGGACGEWREHFRGS